MNDIAYSKVLEALAALGIDDAETVRSVLVEPHQVVVTRLDGAARLDDKGGLVTEVTELRIDYGQPVKHPFEDLVLREEDKALLYTDGVRP